MMKRDGSCITAANWGGGDYRSAGTVEFVLDAVTQGFLFS